MGIITFLLIVANVLISYRGFNNKAFYEKYKFEVDDILLRKEYLRMLTSGFLHVNWMHLIFNMFSLFAFSSTLETYQGISNFCVIYFASLIGGNLLMLLLHRKNGDFSAVGASGAISGVIFATIALFPGMHVGLFFLFIPGWLFGVIYIGLSMYGIRSNRDNIGHEAHLGGALIGMAMAVLINPSAFLANFPVILSIMIPVIIFIYIIIKRPDLLFIDNLYFKQHTDHYSIDHVYNEKRTRDQQELDRLLDKINKKGMEGLSKREKERLKELSERNSI